MQLAKLEHAYFKLEPVNVKLGMDYFQSDLTNQMFFVENFLTSADWCCATIVRMNEPI